jgi:BNR repeat protein
MTRRNWLAGAAGLARAADPGIRREVFLASPAKGVAVMAAAFYTRARGGEMRSIEQRWTRSDTIDAAYYRWSADHGRTWSAPVEHKTGEKTPQGMLRRHPRGWFVDPKTGRALEFWVEGTLPSDDPLEGMRQWNIFYRISEDGGRTDSGVRQVIHKGAEFSAAHPLPGVFTGRNSVMLGDMTCRPIARPDGEILLPVCISPLGPDGKLANPGGGYTYEDTAVLHARWKGKQLEWEMSDMIQGDPRRSTRGAEEPSIEALDGGRLICVLRGSNDRKPELPGYRWVSFSTDGGWKWTKPEPWTYTDGEVFYSPAACSQLLRHSSGRLYWLGNLLKGNPRGNRPRYPFVLGEVDRKSGLLLRDSVRTIDDRAPDEDERLTLSNFFAREDRQTREVVVHMTRLLALPEGWRGDAMLYRI